MSNEAARAMSDEDLVMRLQRWLFDAGRAITAGARPVEIPKVDGEAGVPEGTAARLLEQVIAANDDWVIKEKKGNFLRLVYERVPSNGGGCSK